MSPQGTREAGKQRGADGHAGATGSMTDRGWGCEEGGVTDPPSKAEQAAMTSQQPSRLLLPWSCQGTQVEKEAKLAPGTPKSCRSGRGLGLVSQGLPPSPLSPREELVLSITQDSAFSRLSPSTSVRQDCGLPLPPRQ